MSGDCNTWDKNLQKSCGLERCTECHGADLSGTSAAPTLVGVGQKYDTGTLRSILRQPTDAMSDGGMQPVDIKEGDLTALIAFLESVK